METVFNNLTEIVVMTTEPSDQNTDNIQIISSFVSETASILNQSSAGGNIEPAVIEMVSCLLVIILREGLNDNVCTCITLIHVHYECVYICMLVNVCVLLIHVYYECVYICMLVNVCVF